VVVVVVSEAATAAPGKWPK